MLQEAAYNRTPASIAHLPSYYGAAIPPRLSAEHAQQQKQEQQQKAPAQQQVGASVSLVPSADLNNQMGTTCMGCLRAKVKCSGGTPCDRCSRKGLPCMPRARSRGRPLSEQQKKSRAEQKKAPAQPQKAAAKQQKAPAQLQGMSAKQELLRWHRMLKDGNLSREELMAASERAFELSALLRASESKSPNKLPAQQQQSPPTHHNQAPASKQVQPVIVVSRPAQQPVVLKSQQPVVIGRSEAPDCGTYSTQQHNQASAQQHNQPAARQTDTGVKHNQASAQQHNQPAARQTDTGVKRKQMVLNDQILLPQDAPQVSKQQKIESLPSQRTAQERSQLFQNQTSQQLDMPDTGDIGGQHQLTEILMQQCRQQQHAQQMMMQQRHQMLVQPDHQDTTQMVQVVDPRIMLILPNHNHV